MASPMFKLNAVELMEVLAEDLKAGLAPMVTSSPGMGKSDIIRSLAAKYRLLVLDMRVSQSEPVDMQGYPDVNDKKRMTFRVPEYFPIVGDELPPMPRDMWKQPGIPEEGVLEADWKIPGVPEFYAGWLIFLDEFNSGQKQTEAAAYKLILDKEVYIHKLHPNCRIICAGNLSTDRAIVNTQSTATTSRLVHYELRVDDKIWVDWGNGYGIDHRIISYMKFAPDKLHLFDPDSDEKTFRCPRTWEFASMIIKGKKTIDHLTKCRLVGALGEAGATEFSVFTEIYQNLPTIEQILADPKKGWKVPKEPSEQYAVTTMLSHNINETNVDKMIIAIERLPIDFQVITFKDIYQCAPHMKGHPSIKDWITTNAHRMF